MLTTCPTKLPPEFESLLKRLGRLWADSAICPQIPQQTLSGWNDLVNAWIEDEELPLLIRKGSAVRGSEIVHVSGRRIVPCDNSPAQWAFSVALSGEVPSVQDIRRLFASDKIPVAFAHKSNEKPLRRYHCTLGPFTVNKKGWKLCHINSVGLKSSQHLAEVRLEVLKEKFLRLVAPENHFILPLAWGSLGELDSFVSGFQT